jgi:RimJ/RimL family protein N-acetyltransferase
MLLEEVSPKHYEFFLQLYPDMLEWAACSVNVTSYSSESDLMQANCVWRVFVVDGEAVGLCGLKSINVADRAAEPAIAIVPALRRSGYGIAMSRALVRFAFNDMNLNRLYTSVLPDAPSRELMEKLNFKHEGTMRQSRYKNGRFTDILVYGLLREDCPWV